MPNVHFDNFAIRSPRTRPLTTKAFGYIQFCAKVTRYLCRLKGLFTDAVSVC